MIDPNLIEIWAQATSNKKHGKHYRIGFNYLNYAQFAKRIFKSDNGAIAYGERVIERWKKLYQARQKSTDST